ncbi:hypothetical protein Tcan_09960 [Toxocara canis]|uniref:SH2 domain-containing protein n=1 Tax=Toxocara canis TaxID=6265 RepID=A0A0B2V5C8_TOXCA|nr:hypothetical protein Tcan_09960 [Toxocara canis]
MPLSREAFVDVKLNDKRHISVTPDDDLRTAQVQNERVQAAIIHAAYIGPRKKHEAEEFVAKPTSFKVYHRLPNMLSLGDIRPDLPLFIVYRSGRGKIHHYAVNETRIYEWKGNQLTPMSSFQVEYGDPAAPRFFTLESLIQFYTTYVHLRQTKGGESIADIFPRLRSSRRTCRERIADVE